MIVEAAKMVKAWFIENTALSVESVKIQIEQQRAGSHLSYQDMAVNDAAPADLEQITHHVDAVLLIQSANVMSEPRSLARLYIADKCGIPIVPVVLASSVAEHKSMLYNFEAAKPMMEDLPKHIDADAVAMLENALKEGGQTADTVGKALAQLVPNIISKQLGIQGMDVDIDPQMAEISKALRTGTMASLESTGVNPAAVALSEGTGEDVEGNPRL